jgi:DUF1680 family protein
MMLGGVHDQATARNRPAVQHGKSVDGLAPPVVPPAVSLFPLSSTSLLDGEFKRHQELNRAYLRGLDPDRLLSWCRVEAGLDPKAPPYGGWESGDNLWNLRLPGHILGFYLSAASMMCQACGDDVLRKNIAYTVKELAEVQRANGNGYMLPTVDGKRVFQEVGGGHIETTANHINGVFEPTYVLNKIMLGLYASDRLAGCAEAREVLISAADWFGQDVIDKVNDEQLQKLLDCEHGSLHESFADVYEITGDTRYLQWARRLCHRAILDPLSEGTDTLTNVHANTTIPKLTGFQRIFTFTGETKLARAAEFFWKTVVGERSWVNGGNSSLEHFNDPHDFGKAMWNVTGPESCNSVNMLRLTEALYCAHNSPAMVDYYERTLFNHILPSHEPEKGAFVYFTPMRPGHYRVYSDDRVSMWCCVGTGMESPSKYGRMIYAQDFQGVYINLFIASELRYAEKGVTLTQETRFPEEPRTVIRFSCRASVEFALRIRHPQWVRPGEFSIAVNGQRQTLSSEPGTYAAITRKWKNGDRVEVGLPMRLRLENLPNDESYAAVLYGPILLAGDMGRTNLTKEDCWAKFDHFARRVLPESDVPVFTGRRDEILRRIERVPGDRLAFRTAGLVKPADLELRPFNALHFSRYVVYWQLLTGAEWEGERARRAEIAQRDSELNARTVDRLIIGDPHSERIHRLNPRDTGLGNAPPPGFRAWRELADGKSFSCDLRVEPDASLAVHCEYGAAKDGSWPLEILVDGRTIGNPSEVMRRGVDKAVTGAIPIELTRKKTRITLTLRVPVGASTGGIFDCRIVRV